MLSCQSNIAYCMQRLYCMDPTVCSVCTVWTLLYAVSVLYGPYCTHCLYCMGPTVCSVCTVWTLLYAVSVPVEAPPVRRGRKILLNIVENKKCTLPRLLLLMNALKYGYFYAVVYVMFVSLGKGTLAPPNAY